MSFLGRVGWCGFLFIRSRGWCMVTCAKHRWDPIKNHLGSLRNHLGAPSGTPEKKMQSCSISFLIPREIQTMVQSHMAMGRGLSAFGNTSKSKYIWFLELLISPIPRGLAKFPPPQRYIQHCALHFFSKQPE